MYAVVFQVDVKEGRGGDAREEVDQLAHFVKTLPGFVRGTWAGDDRTGISMILFESEDDARRMADNASMPPDASVTVRSVQVLEVLGEA